MRVVVAVPASGLIAGAALGLALASGSPDPTAFTEHAVLLILPAIAAASGLAAWAWLRSRTTWLATFVTTVFFMGGLLLAGRAWELAWRPTLRIVFDELTEMEREDARATGRTIPQEPAVAAVITGRLRADASPRENGVALSVDVLAIDGGSGSRAGAQVPFLCVRQVRGGVLLTVAGQLASGQSGAWRAGRMIRAPVLLRRPSRYLNPGVGDEERALARRGTTLIGSVKSGALVDVIEKGSRWSEAGAAVRAFARRSIASAVGAWSPRAAGVVTAIVIGDRAGLGPDVQRTLQDAGTYHVIAISGGNIAILAGLTLSAFRLAGLLGPGAMLSAIGGLVAYAYLVGGGASVDRATLMAVVYFAARAIDLRTPPFNTLLLAAGLLIAADPLAVVDPAFLLTFGATVGILVVLPIIQRRRRLWGMDHALAILMASAAAEAVLFPVSAVLFSRVTFGGLVLNLAAIPLMAVAQIAGMLVVAVSAWSSALASGIGWIAAVSADGLLWSGRLVTLMPFVTWRVVPPNVLVVGAYYVGLFVGLWVWHHPGVFRVLRGFAMNRRSILSVPLTICVVAAVWILWEPWTLIRSHGDGRLHVAFLDVGQGDAALVTFPSGQTLLVDAGGSTGSPAFDVGDRVVAPVLRRQGVRRLDILALTHGDADHIGGAPAVVDEFRPREVWEGIPVPRFEPLKRLQALARSAGARWTSLQTADVTTIDQVKVIVRHPNLPDWERQDVRNDDSVVLELRWGEASFVLTGDIGGEAEHSIAAAFPPASLRVVKVPHHGSLTSSSEEFVRALSPRIAVASVGRSNTFGHPAPAVLARYSDVGAEIFRTDRDGAVTVSTDGYALTARTFMGRTVEIH